MSIEPSESLEAYPPNQLEDSEHSEVSHQITNGINHEASSNIVDQSLEDLKKPGCAVEVEADGEWWDANVVEEKDGKIHVHYVGGTDDQDEWIHLNSGRIRPPAKPEIVWALHADGKEHPCAIVEGSLSGSTVEKLCVLSFFDKKRFWVERGAVNAFEGPSAKLRETDNSALESAMAEAMALAQDSIDKHLTLNQILAMEIEPPDGAAEEEAAATAAAAEKKPGRRPRKVDFSHNGFGHVRSLKRGASSAASTEAENRRRKRRAAMRRLGLWPPHDPAQPPSP